MDASEHRFLYEQGGRDWWQVGMRACTLAALPPGARGGRSLDLGAGCGWFVRDLGPGARGVEMSADAVAFARELGADVKQGRIQDALPDTGLTLVTCLDVLPHREVDEPAVLRDAGASLAPGGRLLLRLPAFQRLYGAHDRFVHQVRRYDRADVPTLARQAGLEVERATFANCLLFPLVLAGRLAEALRRGGEEGRSSNRALPRPLNAVLRRVLLAEASLLRRGVNLPFGSSLIVLMRRPA